MSVWLVLSTVALLLLLSGLFSGSETGVYTVSRVQLDAEAQQGGRTARLLRLLLRRDTGLLITLLIGNNLALEILTHVVRHELQQTERVASGVLDIAVAFSLTPLVFLFGELFPKDTFRRRPRFFLGVTAWIIGATRVVFLPIALPLQWLSVALERMLGVRESDLTRALGREEILELLRKGTQEGALENHVERLVQNVFVMRSTPVTAVMIPWGRVVHVVVGSEAQESDDERQRILSAIEGSEFTRLPILGPSQREGSRALEVQGYVHQLDVLAKPDADLAQMLLPLPALSPSSSVDRALVRMQLAGQRVALVGTPEEPLGLLAMMDLVAVIAGVRAA